MAKYVLYDASYVNDRYIGASRENPVALEVADDFVPSRRWLPLDKAAQKALLALREADVARAKKAKENPGPTGPEQMSPTEIKAEIVSMPDPKEPRKEPETNLELQKAGVRFADQRPA